MAPSKAGRPLKFGRPSSVVTLTLPQDVIDALRNRDADLGRAIVSLVEGTRTTPSSDHDTPKVVELMRTGRRGALIVVDPTVVPTLPRCTFMRISPRRAFMALEPGSGLADLELSVIDRMSDLDVTREERRALRTLRTSLRRWRIDGAMTISARSIVVVE